MKIAKTIRKSLTLCLALIFIFSNIAFASATDNADYDLAKKFREEEVIKEFKDNCKDIGINEKTQEKLLKKLQDGKILDSANPERVKKVMDKLTVSNENPKAEYVFKDGSKIVRELKLEDDAGSEIGIMSGSGIIKATARDTNTLHTAEFSAWVYLDVDYNDSWIDELMEETIRVGCVFGTVSYIKPGVSNKYENSREPASCYVQWNYVYQLKDQPIVSGVGTEILYVGDGSVWSVMRL